MTKVVVLGVPFSVGCREETSFAIDQHRAPAVVRHALEEMMAGFDIDRTYQDLGDLKAENTLDSVLRATETEVGNLLREQTVPILVGGAHTFTLGSLRAVHAHTPNYSCIYLDAHPDLMPHDSINYGSSLYYALREKRVDPKRLVLVGARQIERAEQRVIDEYGILTIDPFEFERIGARGVLEKIRDRCPPPYALSLDLDSLEPTSCPGVTTPFPGGLTFREMLFLSCELCRERTLYVDIVELSPVNDHHGESARITAALVHHVGSTLASGPEA